jgi:TonB family protein
VRFTKDDIYSLAGSVAFHLVILLILWFSVLKSIIPEGDEGVLVNFGNVNAAAGTFEPRYTGGEIIPSVPPPSVSVTPVPQQQEDLLTQDTEETVSLADVKKRKEEEERKRQEAERERLRREETERQRLANEQRKRDEEITNRVAGAFGLGDAKDAGQGESSGTGNQGSPFGNSSQGANEGIGGYGSFNLNGRTLGAGGLPRPAYTIQEEGRIVINITVNPEGNVIFAEIGRGTNIDNASMRQSALDAARRATFNSIKGVNINNQNGTITYLYKLR